RLDRVPRPQGLAPTGLGTDVLGATTVIVIAVGAQGVAVGTQRPSVPVVAPRETGGGIGIALIRPDVDHAQGAELPDRVEAGTVADPGVVEPFADRQVGSRALEGRDPHLPDGPRPGIGRGQPAAPGPGG